MKTIFYINCTDVGSTGKIIRNTAAVAKQQGYKSILCAATIIQKDSVFHKQFVVSGRIRRAITYRVAKITGNRYGMSFFSTWKLTWEIRRQNPNVVHIHCANGSFINIYQLMQYLKKHRIPTVVTNHAEFFYTGNCDHAYDCDRWRTGCRQCPQRFSLFDTTHIWWKKMKRAFSGFPGLAVTSVSPWTMSRCAASPIMEGTRQFLVENGVDATVFHPYDEEETWRKYGICWKKKKVVLYVTAFFYGNRPEKGSKYLYELAERFVGKGVIFAVAGNHAPNLAVPENVHLLGKITDQQELAKLYSAANLTLITSQRETFSMPVAESLCCGTPVIGFQAGGPESIALKEYSEFIEFADVEALEKVMLEKWLCYKSHEVKQMISNAATERYCETKMGNRYISIYEEITEAVTNEP